MGSAVKVSLGQQEDVGVLAIAAVRYALGDRTPASSVSICGAVAHLVPVMSETDIRMLMYEVDAALKSDRIQHHEWAELMVVLRRVDRP